MATKYYDDGSYTKGDGKLYYPGLGVVGTDKSSSSSSNKTSNTSKTTSTSSKTSGSSGVSSMYKNNSSSSSSSTSILDKMMDNVKNNPLSSGGSSSNVNKTNSGWYVSSGSTNKPVVEEVEEVNPYEDELAELRAYKEQQEALIREQNRLAVEQGVNRLEAQKTGINQSAEDNARQAYIMHMQAQKALPQQLASQGITGGATETANLGLQTTYQNNVNEINRNKANALQDIDNAIVDLQNTGDLSTVEQVLANNQAALNAYMSNLDKQVGYNQWAKEFNANREDTLAEQAYRDKVYADQMAQQELENQWYERSYKDAQQKEETNRIITLLENGMYNPETASALLGVPTTQLDDFVNYIKKARNLELNNTQSLISNRNNTSGGSNGGAGNAVNAGGNVTEGSALEQNYYNLIDRINNKYYGNTVGKEADMAVIAPDANNTYGINPNIHRGSYLDLIIAETLRDGNLSAQEQVNFLNALQISDTEIERVAGYLGGQASTPQPSQTSQNNTTTNATPPQSTSTVKPTLADYINYFGNGAGLNPAIDIVLEAKENEKNNPYTLKLQEYYRTLGFNDEEIAAKVAAYKTADVANQAKILREAGIM